MGTCLCRRCTSCQGWVFRTISFPPNKNDMSSPSKWAETHLTAPQRHGNYNLGRHFFVGFLCNHKWFTFSLCQKKCWNCTTVWRTVLSQGENVLHVKKLGFVTTNMPRNSLYVSFEISASVTTKPSLSHLVIYYYKYKYLLLVSQRQLHNVPKMKNMFIVVMVFLVCSHGYLLSYRQLTSSTW